MGITGRKRGANSNGNREPPPGIRATKLNLRSGNALSHEGVGRWESWAEPTYCKQCRSVNGHRTLEKWSVVQHDRNIGVVSANGKFTEVILEATACQTKDTG